MVLWTIQPEEVYEELLKTGVYHCCPEKTGIYEDFKEEYDWLAGQIKKKIGNPPDGVTLPIWAWYQWEDVRKKPDLRSARWRYGSGGEKYVCLECDIPDDEVLLSDFDLWSQILLHSPITWTEEEDKEIESNMEALPEEEQKLFMHKNWEERLFDITPFENEWTIRGSSIQATFWELRLDQVKGIWHFEAAKRRPM